jgi:hypothetical protein
MHSGLHFQFRCIYIFQFSHTFSYTAEKLHEPSSVVGLANGYGLDDRGAGFRVPVGPRTLTSSYRPDRLWDSFNLLSNEYWGLFLRE